MRKKNVVILTLWAIIALSMVIVLITVAFSTKHKAAFQTKVAASPQYYDCLEYFSAERGVRLSIGDELIISDDDIASFQRDGTSILVYESTTRTCQRINGNSNGVTVVFNAQRGGVYSIFALTENQSTWDIKSLTEFALIRCHAPGNKDNGKIISLD